MKIDLAKFNKILAKAASFGVLKGIIPVLDGFSSYDPDTRKRAREGLLALQKQIEKKMSAPGNNHVKAMGEAAVFSALIYHEICTNHSLTENDVGLFFNTLMGTGEKGRFYAWQIWCNRYGKSPYLRHQVDFFPDDMKLYFVEQYLNADLRTRRAYARFFRELLAGIKSREAVLKHLGRIVRQTQDFDPFWYNLPPGHLDPDPLYAGELSSDDEKIRANALAVLSLISPPLKERLLTSILQNDPSPLVRITAFQVIESALPRTYSELTKVLLPLLGKKDDHGEAMAVFRALIASGLVPPHRLMSTVMAKHRQLIPPILKEIRSCSRITFFFVQDMAVTPDWYFTRQNPVFGAMFAGIASRRPFETLRLLELSGEKKISALIKNWLEKTCSEFHQIADKAQERTRLQWKTPPTPQRIKEMAELDKGGFSRDNEAKIRISDFSFHQTQFTGMISPSHGYLFDKTRFHACDLSDLSVENSSFDRCVFNQVDLTDTRFSNVSFDGAVFADVRGRGAVFHRCTFRNTKFHEADFTSSRLTECLITDAVFYKTDFSFAVFLGTSLISSRMFKTNFSYTAMEQVVSYGLQAIDCPGCYAGSNHLAAGHMEDNLDNLEEFKMPNASLGVLQRIRLIIFAFFTGYGHGKFMGKNRLALLSASDVFMQKAFDLFEIIPLLLHENLSFPGYNAYHQNAPCGIRHYTPPLGVRSVLGKYLKKKSTPLPAGGHFFIEGLFTIGSAGTIAQNKTSDIDYWVCIDDLLYTPEMTKNIEEKLEKLENWALDNFKTEIHFFILSLKQIRQNAFGETNTQGSGSAQAVILKDEFYRTMIHIAGRVPLWAVLPQAVSQHHYAPLRNLMGKSPEIYPYMDLGNINHILSEEFYGALIWQLFKGVQNAFKSIIKLALVEMYYLASPSSPLLCNRFKENWINRSALTGAVDNDPYCALIKSLVNFYTRKNDVRSADLIKLCFILQLSDLNPSEVKKTVFEIKETMVKEMIAGSGWENNYVFKLGNLKKWHFSNIIKISDIIKKHFLTRYKTLRQNLGSDKANLMSAKDRTILARRMYVQFATQPDKLENMLLVVRNQKYFQELILNHDRTGNHWHLVHRSGRAGKKKEETLKAASTIEEIAAWMINNQLYTQDTLIQMAPNPTYVTSEDVNRLFSTMQTLFSAYDRSRIRSAAFLSKPKVRFLFTSVNFYASRTSRQIDNGVAVYVNSWGEMYCTPFSGRKGSVSTQAMESLLPEILGIKYLPPNRIWFFPKRFEFLAQRCPLTHILSDRILN